jgi:ectoine hydroxylase-related dioxygenase (phytanoyl-CoA dioxygenase family)
MYIYYPELLNDGKWGDDKIILNNDINLLQTTEFDNLGYCILDAADNNELITNIVKTQIYEKTQKIFDLEKYHNVINDEEHKRILNTMPYKKNMNDDVSKLSKYLEDIVSNTLNEKVKIFNNDIWFRICRPTSLYPTDFNPCHKDIYLDFYRNTVNIYLPVVGSNDLSSLTIQPGSHKWNENETYITSGGAFFKSNNKKYSVDAIVASKQPIQMIRPNPSYCEMLLFSPYLIHGCANNHNIDMTRISMEVRFIKDDNSAFIQEKQFNEFLNKRLWR